MRKRILSALREGWETPMIEYTKGKDFFTKIYIVYCILTQFDLGSKSTVALYGRNSFNWIAIYIACLLKGVKLLIIHPNMDSKEVTHITMITNTNHIFIDPDLELPILWKNVFLKTLISTENLNVLCERSTKYNYSSVSRVIVDSLISKVQNISILDTFDEEEISQYVITGTSGTESASIKWVEMHSNAISNMVTKAMPLVPYDDRDKVYSNIEFASSHFVTVLLPFIKQCVFVGDPQYASVFIEDSNSISETWRQNVTSLYSKFFLSYLFSLSWTKPLFKKLATLVMKKHYGKKVKSIIIYNSVMNDEILLTLVGKLPIYTTYGSQETCQLVAINDYSSKDKNRPYAVGRMLPGIRVYNHGDELSIYSPTILDRYIGDEVYTQRLVINDVYKTGDVGFFEEHTNILFVFGRKVAVYHNDFKLPIELDKLERAIKSIPYVKEVILWPYHIGANGTREGKYKLILCVYPDIKFVETKKLGLLKLKELMKVYLIKINQELINSVTIDEVKIVTEPLPKTHDGKICRYYFS